LKNKLNKSSKELSNKGWQNYWKTNYNNKIFNV